MRLRYFILAASSAAFGADWLTDGADRQRTNWQRDEKILSTDNAKNIKLLWNLPLDNKPREMHALMPTLIASNVPTSSGPKEIAIVAGAGDNIFGIDVKAGKVIWRKHFDFVNGTQMEGRGPLCPAGLLATPTIGEADARGARPLYAISGDGMMHFLNAGDGEDTAPPAKFMPPNGKPYALNLREGVLYSTTAQGCGGNPNLIYSFDLKTKTTKTYNPKGGGLWGRSGAAIGFDGTIYAPTGDAGYDPAEERYGNLIISVTPDLKYKDHYAPSNIQFLWKRDLDAQVTPAVFKYKDRELLVSACKECRLWLMDSKSLGGADHRTPLVRTPLLCNEEVNFAEAGIWGSMTTWEDASGTRWILTGFWGPSHPKFKPPISHGPVKRGAVVAHKVEEKNGKIVLTPVWMSRDMDMAEPPVVANGVVYAYGSGESNIQVKPELGLAANTSAMRVSDSSHATLFAFDGQTGKELWNSGNQIKTFAHFGALSVANGRVYLGTYDSMLYSFGIEGR